MVQRQSVISIGIPCYNEDLNVKRTYGVLCQTLQKNKKYAYEFIFVDNGSKDNTKEEIKKIAIRDKRVIGVFLSRNFGPEASGQAALDTSSGSAFVMYEADMQDPPDLILEFIKKWEEGYQVVVGVRNKIDDNPLMIFVRKMYYKIFRAISNIDVPVNAGSFGLVDRKVADAIKKMSEKYRFFRGLRAWVGFKSTYIAYQRRKRAHGKSSYTFFKYIKHAERSFFGFSYLPLDMIIYAGVFLVVVSFAFIVGYLVWTIFYGNYIDGSVAILLSIIFLGGVQLLAVSIIGKYIQVIVEETKNRPVYVIDEIVNKK